ncbi:hypothetical protein [Kitasatospora griseola]|uniref:hypothetical protein n=1 Tax=Kitasatospora griseola TaxID=2064 RepID=UPI00341480F0
MALDFDSSRAVMGLRDQQRLLQAVLGASDADEQRWLEWKSSLDLTSAHGAFTTAKAILGFANRMPDVAVQWAQGHAYLLVGIEPGNACGVPRIDIEKLDPKLARYLGDFERYQLTYVPFDTGQGTVDVLFVDVAPPSWGDLIHPLRKDYDKYRQGTVFHRSSGRTEPASAREIDELCQRVLRGTPAVEVSLSAQQGVVSAVHFVDADLELLLEERRDALLARLPAARRSTEDTPPAPYVVNSSREPGRRSLSFSAYRELQARQAAGGKITDEEREALRHAEESMREASQSVMATMASMFRSDSRTPEQFREEVDAYVGRLRRAVPAVLTAEVISRSAPVRFELRNPTDRFLAQVEAVIHLPAGIQPLLPEEYDELVRWPEPPKAYGQSDPFGISAFTVPPLARPHTCVPRVDPFPRPAIEATGSSTTIRFPAVDVRAHEQLLLDPVTLVAGPEIDGVSVRWSATATNLDGRIEGVVQLTAMPLTVDLGASFPSAP